MTEPTITTLPEFADNPFISNLPPILSRREMVNVLTRLPSFDVKERNYPPHIRKYCVLRLVEFFVPIDRHLQYFERVDMTIRQGYRGKNPNTCDYISRLQDSSERLRQKNLMAEPLKPYENFASSFALLGTSGVGKTRSTNVIFQHFPQTIKHEVPFRLTQIVWLRLDCPSEGIKAARFLSPNGKSNEGMASLRPSISSFTKASGGKPVCLLLRASTLYKSSSGYGVGKYASITQTIPQVDH